MPTPRPTISRFQFNNIAEVCAIGPERLRKVAELLNASSVLLAKAKVDAILVEGVGKSAGEELSTFLFGIMSGYRQNDRIADVVLKRVNDYVEAHPDEKELANWPACRPVLERLLGAQSVKLAAKAIDVSYDFERVYMGGRFLTTVRPVFDEERLRIMGAAIVQTLRIEFFSGDAEPANLSIAMDRLDIVQLRDSCNEALRKSDIAYRTATEDWRLPAVISGSADEEPSSERTT